MNESKKVSLLFVSTVVLVLFFAVNALVKRKTKGMEVKDSGAMANRLALKLSGLDNPFELKKFVEQDDAGSVAKYLDSGYSPNTAVASMPLLEIAIESDA